jgi:hypothetical protein
MDNRDARPSNSGEPLKLIATNHSLKRGWGHGERPNGYSNNAIRCELDSFKNYLVNNGQS